MLHSVCFSECNESNELFNECNESNANVIESCFSSSQLRAYRGLQGLCVRQCRAVGDASLELLARYCVSLRKLDVSRCAAVRNIVTVFHCSGLIQTRLKWAQAEPPFLCL